MNKTQRPNVFSELKAQGYKLSIDLKKIATYYYTFK